MYTLFSVNLLLRLLKFDDGGGGVGFRHGLSLSGSGLMFDYCCSFHFRNANECNIFYIYANFFIFFLLLLPLLFVALHSTTHLVQFGLSIIHSCASVFFMHLSLSLCDCT